MLAIKDTKFYVPVVTLSAKHSRLLSKAFERALFWNENRTKNENKNTICEYRYFLEPNFVVVKRLFIFIFI